MAGYNDRDDSFRGELKKIGLTEEQISALPISGYGYRVSEPATGEGVFAMYFTRNVGNFSKTVDDAIRYFENRKDDVEDALEHARHLAVLAEHSTVPGLASAAALFNKVDPG